MRARLVRWCVQVAAYCNGRDTVTEYDALLLQHVLWQRPEQADRIADWVVSQLSVDDGLKQVGVQSAQSDGVLREHQSGLLVQLFVCAVPCVHAEGRPQEQPPPPPCQTSPV